MKITNLLILLFLVIYLCSCKTTRSFSNYVENVKKDTTWAGQPAPELTIQKNDLLSIQIYSLSTRREADELYNLPSGGTTTTSSGGGSSSGGPAPVSGYLVDLDGNIIHHRLGIIHAEGLTKQALANEIKKRLTEPVVLLNDPTIIIRLINFKVTVLGDVESPGSISVPGERISILEALGLAGDFTPYGKKQTVRVSREVNGQREIGTIDLSSANLYNSQFYYLRQNDVVFVEPSKQKARLVDQQVVTQRITLALSLITAAAFIYNIFK